MRFEVNMKFDAFTKTGFVRIVATSLMLSVYVIAIVMNYILPGYTSGQFAMTLLFCFSLAVFGIFAKLKNHPPLLWGARGWLIASSIVFVLGIIFSLIEIQLSGFFGRLIGCCFVIISPYFGIFYLIDVDWIYADVMLGIIGIVISVLIWFIPELVQKAVDRRKLVKKYR